MNSKIIPRLDFLRAFAVLIVVFFHLKIPGFKFGYLGVDLFFMLSGFLMTHTMMLDRQKYKTFRVKQFFIRRIRRIVPSLFITVLMTGLLAFVFFSPEQLFDTSKQGLTAQLFSSNILFFSQAGYFAPENEFRVLLHTWSLAVEEQCYILFGLMLFVGKKVNFSAIMIIMGVLGLVVLCAAYWTLLNPERAIGWLASIPNLDAAIFYLLPFRIVQFIAGGLIAIALFGRQPIKSIWFTSLGIIIPTIAMFLLFQFTLAQTLSSVLVMISFAFVFVSNPILDKLGRLPLIKFTAKISYQIYLTHWPFIVFWRYWTFEELNTTEIAILFVLSIVSGWGLFWVSNYITSSNFSWAKSARIVFGTFIVSSFIFGAGLFTQGVEGRLPEDRRLNTPAKWREIETSYCNDILVDGEVEPDQLINLPLVTCSRASSNPATIYALGDSHARHLVPGLSEAFPDHTIAIMYFSSCIAQSGFEGFVYSYNERAIQANACVERNRRAMEFFRTAAPSTIIIHQFSGYDGDNSPEWYAAAKYVIDTLTSYGHAVTWIGSVLRPNILVADCIAVPDIFSDEYLSERCVGDIDTISSICKKNQALSQDFPAVFINTNQFFCPNLDIDKCSVIRDGIPLFRDKHHLTAEGSIAFIQSFKEQIALQD